MAKRKKNESIKDFRERVAKSEILDTTAGEMMCETGGGQPDILLETRLGSHRKADTIVFSMRMGQRELDHFKQLAREKSATDHKDVSYQQFITEAALENHPIPEEK
jgi:hypothetical protein